MTMEELYKTAEKVLASLENEIDGIKLTGIFAISDADSNQKVFFQRGYPKALGELMASQEFALLRYYAKNDPTAIEGFMLARTSNTEAINKELERLLKELEETK